MKIWQKIIGGLVAILLAIAALVVVIVVAYDASLTGKSGPTGYKFGTYTKELWAEFMFALSGKSKYKEKVLVCPDGWSRYGVTCEKPGGTYTIPLRTYLPIHRCSSNFTMINGQCRPQPHSYFEDDKKQFSASASDTELHQFAQQWVSTYPTTWVDTVNKVVYGWKEGNTCDWRTHTTLYSNGVMICNAKSGEWINPGLACIDDDSLIDGVCYSDIYNCDAADDTATGANETVGICEHPRITQDFYECPLGSAFDKDGRCVINGA